MKPSTAFRAVNLLYFIVLCLMAANVFLAWLPQYVRLTANEILFVFLPAYLFLRLPWHGTSLSGQPVAERVRWRWPGWRVAFLSLLVGAGLYPLSAISASVLMGVLGYTNFAVPADAIPTTALMGGLAVLSYAVLAPLCEEFLFRGVIQPVYETRGGKWGVLVVGLLFVAFHLSLLQGLSILLLALALGYVNYRTRSLPASMLTHFGANGLAALMVTQRVFPTGIQKWITSLPALAGGLLLAGIALFFLIRLTHTDQIDPSMAMRLREMESAAPKPLPAVPARRGAGWLAEAWPLLAALVLYLPMIGAEWVFSRSPQLIAGLQAASPAVQVGASPWKEPHAWRYEIRNVADAVVGEGECRLNPAGEEMELTCTSTVQAYEVKQGQSTFASSGGTRIDILRWQSANGQFVSGTSALELQGGFTSKAEFNLGDDRIVVRYQQEDQPEKSLDLPFSKTAFSKDPTLPVTPDYTWPWQLAGICDSAGDGGTLGGSHGSVLRFNPYTWNNTTRASGPLAEPKLVKVTAPVEVQAPVERLQTCSAARGEHDIAWYGNIDGALTVVKYFNGIETWYLKQ